MSILIVSNKVKDIRWRTSHSVSFLSSRVPKIFPYLMLNSSKQRRAIIRFETYYPLTTADFCIIVEEWYALGEIETNLLQGVVKKFAWINVYMGLKYTL